MIWVKTERPHRYFNQIKLNHYILVEEIKND